MNLDIHARLKNALKSSEFWLPSTKEKEKTISPLKCPACGKPEAYAFSVRPFAICCNRASTCGMVTKIRELFPELLFRVERDFKPTSSDPHRPARAFLEMRGLSASLEGLSFEYWKNIRNTGGGGVMFPVDAAAKTYNGRLFDPPSGEGKTHNKGTTTGKFWRHPGRVYAPDAETFITEGIIDALSLIEMGLQAIAILSSGQNPAGVDLREFRRLVFAFDNDHAGTEATKKWMKHYNQYPA
ncbi:MAG: hypothetical protein C4518_04545 [Desulfobacteraceae bacterium]|nr:MAG: hypothetical protein C4518_04545 [Desulfobacteraceae bacterium]